MSRIREALKKAAEERSAGAGRTTEDFIDALEAKAPVATTAVTSPPLISVQRTVVKVADQPENLPYKEFVAKCRQVQWRLEPRYSVFTNEENHRAGAERFRTLRSRLHQIAAAQPLKRVLLTSSVPQEGKTFVASNLAQSIIRQEGKKVLLIDADLRASAL